MSPSPSGVLSPSFVYILTILSGVLSAVQTQLGAKQVATGRGRRPTISRGNDFRGYFDAAALLAVHSITSLRKKPLSFPPSSPCPTAIRQRCEWLAKHLGGFIVCPDLRGVGWGQFWAFGGRDSDRIGPISPQWGWNRSESRPIVYPDVRNTLACI